MMMHAASASSGRGVSAGTVPIDELRTLHDASPAAVRRALADDGYALLRGVADRDAVLRAREAVLGVLVRAGVVEPGSDRCTGKPADAAAVAAAADVAPLVDLVGGTDRMALFDEVFGEPARTFDFRWFRPVGPGEFTSVHCDRVFMGRGSDRLLTAWTPLGDVPLELGPVALWLGSPWEQQIRSAYASRDVDRDLIDGYVATDPAEALASMGGRLASTDFAAGDLLVFGMDVLHCSLTNSSADRVRLSCDTRYQPAAEPADDRWVGSPPAGHTRWRRLPGESLAAGRQRMGLPPLAVTPAS